MSGRSLSTPNVLSCPQKARAHSSSGFQEPLSPSSQAPLHSGSHLPNSKTWRTLRRKAKVETVTRNGSLLWMPEPGPGGMDFESPLGISGHIAKSLRKPPGSVLAPALGGAVDPAAQLQAAGGWRSALGPRGPSRRGGRIQSPQRGPRE